MRTKLTVAALAVFGLVLASAPAFAQEAKVTIPFAFTVGGKVLPAGVYQITERSSDVLELQSVNVPSRHVFVPVLDRIDANGAPRTARVVFDKHGSKRELTEVWIDGEDGYVLELP